MENLHPQTQAMIQAMAAMNLLPPDQLTPVQARAQFHRGRLPFLAAPQPVESARNVQFATPVGAIPVRIYRPQGSPPSQRLPCLLFFHGGGWVQGDVDSHDPLCRELCNASGWCVVSVDYRLAPENKFPGAVDDAIASVRHVYEHAVELGVDASRLAVGGDSAGGNLAAVTALTLRDAGGPKLALQLLMYPVTDLAMDTASYAAMANGYTLTRDRMRYFRDAYLPDMGAVADWRASPLKARDLSSLPPALIQAAAYDPLLDEGQAYAERLRAAGVSTTYTCYPGMVHGFMSVAGAIDLAHVAIKEAAEALKRVG